MLSEISVPLDGFANTHYEISVALRLARQHRCPVVGWKIRAGHVSGVPSGADDEYGSRFEQTQFGHHPVDGETIMRRFLEEAQQHGVATRIGKDEILDVADFYHKSTASDLAVVSSETVRFWRSVETNAFLRGDFSSYRMAPLLVLGAFADNEFEEVVFAYDGSEQAKLALEAYANMETRPNHAIKILVCDVNPARASKRAEEAERLVTATGMEIKGVAIHRDLINWAVDSEYTGRSVLVVAGLCTHPHAKRLRFGHLADHLIESQAASMLLAY